MNTGFGLLRGLARRWARHTGGSTLVIFALSLAALSVLTAGGIELAFLSADRSKLQQAADAAALWGAAELTMSTSTGVETRAEDYARQQWGPAGQRLAAVPTAEVIELPDNSQALKVSIKGHRESFFGNMLPPGGFDVGVSSTALAVGMEPLCVLVHDEEDKGDTLKIANTSRINAPDCLVQSNNDIKVDAGALLAAGLTQAVTKASGPITPKARIGAKPIPDPFLNMDLKFKSCGLSGITGALLPVVYSSGGDETLSAGLHCGGIIVKNGTTLHVSGDNFFVGDLDVQDTSKLVGDDVVFGFDKSSKFTFGGQSVVTLGGRKTGTYAGFVIFTTRENDKDFVISSDHVTQLLGTIYVPNAVLHVNGKGKVAQDSAWTVIVAKNLKLEANAILYINAGYAQSDVPVPGGVGSKAHSTRLTN